MGLVALLLPVCFICLLVIILNLFTNTANNNLKLGWKQRLWIVLNLLMWAYEFFFMVVVCEGVENLRVDFGGGLGDLFYIFMLAGVVMLHIVLLAICTYKHLQSVYFIILVCLPILPLAKMHWDAARGKKENGYMTRGNSTGLYYDAEAYRQLRLHKRELEEAAKPKKPEFATQFESYLYDAEHGDLWAQNHIGRCYALGDGVEQNDSLAIKWYRLAAEGGYDMSQSNLGVCYYKGLCGLDIDYIEAVKWLRKAAEQGNDDAQYLMRCCYKDGKGVEQNDEEAFRWLRLAARQEHEGAQKLLRENKQVWQLSNK